MNNNDKGSNYEKQIYEYLLLNNPTFEIYLWKYVPIKYLIELKFINDNKEIKDIKNIRDIGCDILIKTDSNKFIFVQCKNYFNKNICVADISGFCFLLAFDVNVEGLLITNTDISANIKLKLNNQYRIKHSIISYNEIETKIKENQIISNNIQTIIPHKYQIDAYNCLIDKIRGILKMPCGTGKTLVSILLAKNYDNVIIFSPLLLYAAQLLESYKKEIKSNYIL